MTFGIATGSYEDVRDDWLLSVERALNEQRSQVELSAIRPNLLDSLEPFLADHAKLLEGFARVSLHAPIKADDRGAAVEQILALPLDGAVILHPDTWWDEPAVERLGARAVFENMDIGKSFGRSVADLQEVFDRWPDAGFCLDVAHVWTNDASLALGHDLIDAFGERLSQLHVSGTEPDGTHRTTTAADLALYRPLLGRCAAVAWILETVVEPA